MPQVYISFGSNLGDRAKNIQTAIRYLEITPAIKIEKVSSFIETEPEGGPPQSQYLNGVIKINSNLSCQQVLSVLQDIEKKMGRVRTVKDGPRVIDLDILLYGEEIIDEPNLKIPHPRMFEREFVMKPLLEISPSILFTHPLVKEYRDAVLRLISRTDTQREGTP